TRRSSDLNSKFFAQTFCPLSVVLPDLEPANFPSKRRIRRTARDLCIYKRDHRSRSRNGSPRGHPARRKRTYFGPWQEYQFAKRCRNNRSKRKIHLSLIYRITFLLRHARGQKA